MTWQDQRIVVSIRLCDDRLQLAPDLAEIRKWPAVEAILNAMRQQLVFGEHNVGLTHGESIREAVADEDHRSVRAAPPPNHFRLAGSTAVLAAFGPVREIHGDRGA